METQALEGQQGCSKPCTVMVVEDDVGCREILGEFLRIWGYEVESAADGKEALEQLHDPSQRRPCVILLDLMMPVMGGWEFRRKQFQDPSLSDIPVVVVSAARDALKSEVSSLRASEYLKKPVDFDRLGVVVRRLCG